jgi:hypothetical protein
MLRKEAINIPIIPRHGIVEDLFLKSHASLVPATSQIHKVRGVFHFTTGKRSDIELALTELWYL